MNRELINKLIEEAQEIANRNFCCSHSGYTVGAALLTSEGKVYKGFNIENDGIQSICAERVAFAKALSEDNHKFSCIVVVGKKLVDKDFAKTLPCGYCRQFMSEYVGKDFMIFTYDSIEDKIYSYSIGELLPESFRL
ncbi:MAG TPA: cytidine deaminase [Firmicutes bacterium]|nr:cytidine deaminase [Bacillota bacterium]